MNSSLLFRIYLIVLNKYQRFDKKFKLSSYLQYSKIDPSIVLGQYTNFQFDSESAFLEIDKNVIFKNHCNILMYKNGFLKINKNVFFNNFCSINCLGKIEIGENTMFGEGVKIYDHNHKYDYINTNLKVENINFTIGEITIGKNCWIGSNVTILNNVVIGDNTIIGANCLIYKSIPSNSIVKHNEVLIIDN